MNALLSTFAPAVLGSLSGFDRLVFRGTLRSICYPLGLGNFLFANHVPFKDFGDYSQGVTEQLTEASLRQAHELGREVRYLNNTQLSKEQVARDIAARDGITEGLVCVLKAVDPCMAFAVHRDRASRRLRLGYRRRQCLHLYHYQVHPVFGFMHARIQTWFPFRVYVCLNGREWLARQMDQAGLAYTRRDNCFVWLQDVARAQALFDEQLLVSWAGLLDELRRSLNPAHEAICAKMPLAYYWSVDQSEWASDVMFRSRRDLGELYPLLVRHSITTYGPGDVLRFLGRRIAPTGRVPAHFAGELSSEGGSRAEGVRVKHRLNGNSLKMYDKGSVLRVETTINQPGDFKVYRAKEGDPDGPKDWRPLRHGVADLQRRAEVSQAANDRYLGALAAVRGETRLRELAEPLCQPAASPGRQRGGAAAARPRRVRALNPLGAADAALLAAVARPEFMQNGLRHRDLRRLLYPGGVSAAQRRRVGAALTRQLRLLRGHGLIHKVPRTHRYVVSESGRLAITALLAARDSSAEKLTALAA
jgi:hypothetical protein